MQLSLLPAVLNALFVRPKWQWPTKLFVFFPGQFLCGLPQLALGRTLFMRSLTGGQRCHEYSQ